MPLRLRLRQCVRQSLTPCLNGITLRKRHFWKALKGRFVTAQGKALGKLNKIYNPSPERAHWKMIRVYNPPFQGL